jgi:hypothetical protein
MKQKRTKRNQRKSRNRITQKKRITQKGGTIEDGTIKRPEGLDHVKQAWGVNEKTAVTTSASLRIPAHSKVKPRRQSSVKPLPQFENGIYLLTSNGYKNGVELKSEKEGFINDIPLRNVKFMSTHNSYITPCQFGCDVLEENVMAYLSYIDKFPICIEIDIENNKVEDQIMVGHVTKNKIPLETIFSDLFNFFNTNFVHGHFFPLIISIDNSQLKKKRPSYSDTLRGIRYLFDSNFGAYLLTPEQRTSNILDLPLSQLIGKILIRFKGTETDIADIGNIGNHTLPFTGGNEFDLEDSRTKEQEFLRIYPKDSIPSVVKQYITSRLPSSSPGKTNEALEDENLYDNTKGILDHLESKEKSPRFKLFGKKTVKQRRNSDDYKKLSGDIIDAFLLSKNNINCVAFNFQDLKDGEGNFYSGLLDAFILTYSNFKSTTFTPSKYTRLLTQEQEGLSPAERTNIFRRNSTQVGGAKTKKQNKKIKSNKKSYLKKKY